MSPILVQNTTEVAKLSSSANIISRPLAKMRARPLPMPRPPVLRAYSRGNTSVATGVPFPWTDGRKWSRGYRVARQSIVQMEGIAVRLLTSAVRATVPAAGLLALLVLQLHHVRLAGATPVRARALVFSQQARRLLVLQYQSYPTEFLGCMIGAVRGDAVIVQRIAPADVNPGESTRTSVVPR